MTYLKSEKKYIFVTYLGETKNFWSQKCDRSACTPCEHRNSLRLTESRPMYNVRLCVTETRDRSLASHTLPCRASGNSEFLHVHCWTCYTLWPVLKEQESVQLWHTAFLLGFLQFFKGNKIAAMRVIRTPQSLYDLMMMAKTWDVVWFLSPSEIQHEYES